MLTNEKESFIEAWGSFAEDDDALKKLHHPDVTVLDCCFPAKCEEYEGYDSVFFHHKAVAQYHSFIVPLTSQSDVLTFQWASVGKTTSAFHDEWHGHCPIRR